MLLSSTHHNHERDFYVETVLGIDASKMLLEGDSRSLVNAQILSEHLLLEGWLDNAAKWLKDKSANAFEAVKKKGTDVVDAMKLFPDKVAGIVAAFYKIMTDSKEAEAYLSGTLGSARHKSFKRTLLQIASKFEEYNLNSFAKAIRSLVESAWGMLENFRSAGGWKGFFGVLAFGIAIGKIEDEYGEAVKRLKEFMHNPVDALKELLGNAAIGELKSASKEKTKQTLLKLFSNEKVQQHIAELTGFANKAKKMVLGALKKLTGAALESLAGPIGWIKKAGEVFQASNAVVNTIQMYLRRFGSVDEALLRRLVRQTIIAESMRKRRPQWRH